MTSAKILYHWTKAVGKHFVPLSKPQASVLALFSLGVARAGSCVLNRVAQALPWIGKLDTVERRLQRFLANPRIHLEPGCVSLARWVLSSLSFASNTLVLLVDETARAEHLRVMAVGLAYRGRAIPLAWWCYPQDQYPMRQVELIDTLLGWVAPFVKPGYDVLVEMDRGLGTSPALLRRILKRGWHYLVRVQGSVRLRSEGQEQNVPFKSWVTGPGQKRSGWVRAFKKAGWLPCWAMAYWGEGYKEPWLLLSDWDQLQAPCYGWRMWEELAFRDLKSYGWNWQKSRVWDPDHSNRLWLVMALAYAWTLSLGTQAAHLLEVRREVTRGKQKRHSLFNLGIRVVHYAENIFKLLLRPFLFDFLFIPSPRPP
jgi:DDE family transposase